MLSADSFLQTQPQCHRLQEAFLGPLAILSLTAQRILLHAQGCQKCQFTLLPSQVKTTSQVRLLPTEASLSIRQPREEPIPDREDNEYNTFPN